MFIENKSKSLIISFFCLRVWFVLKWNSFNSCEILSTCFRQSTFPSLRWFSTPFGKSYTNYNFSSSRPALSFARVSTNHEDKAPLSILCISSSFLTFWYQKFDSKPVTFVDQFCHFLYIFGKNNSYKLNLTFIIVIIKLLPRSPIYLQLCYGLTKIDEARF